MGSLWPSVVFFGIVQVVNGSLSSPVTRLFEVALGLEPGIQVSVDRVLLYFLLGLELMCGLRCWKRRTRSLSDLI